MRNLHKQSGFINIILAIVLGLIFLRIIGVNVLDILDQPWFKDFAILVKGLLKEVWADILAIFQFFVKA